MFTSERTPSVLYLFVEKRVINSFSPSKFLSLGLVSVCAARSRGMFYVFTFWQRNLGGDWKRGGRKRGLSSVVLFVMFWCRWKFFCSKTLLKFNPVFRDFTNTVYHLLTTSDLLETTCEGLHPIFLRNLFSRHWLHSYWQEFARNIHRTNSSRLSDKWPFFSWQLKFWPILSYQLTPWRPSVTNEKVKIGKQVSKENSHGRNA